MVLQFYLLSLAKGTAKKEMDLHGLDRAEWVDPI